MLSQLQTELRAKATSEKAANSQRFFKAGPGGYAEGDTFIGVTVPEIRATIKPYKTMSLPKIETLLHSSVHEDRLAALLIMVMQAKVADEIDMKQLYELYLQNTANINNWDLVDSSAEFIVGPYLEDRPEKMRVLQKLAWSSSLWERRIAMLATFDYIKKGCADEALVIAELLLNDDHDLIHKAVGWMLREIGKRVDQQTLLDFLNHHAATMPRTALRYAIERLTPEQRGQYMSAR